MTTILGAAASGMAHNQNVLDTVGHNLANANTYAYKKVRPLAEGRPDPAAVPEGGRLGVAETTRDVIFSQAATQITDNPLHFSIEDDAFFKVLDFDGSTAFTRFGELTSDQAGNITAFRGRLLDPAITLGEGMTQPAIDRAGVISALDADGARVDVGQVSVFRFVNPQGLELLGDGLYRETVNSGQVTAGTPASEGFAALRPGSLEGSNVDVAEEFTNMIIAQRAYQACAKTFSVGDEMLALATDLTR
jgi:flagellar basal-body rod protein FlgG